ncbi:hypothetical protein D3C84_1185470 [compost metagenome]
MCVKDGDVLFEQRVEGGFQVHRAGDGVAGLAGLFLADAGGTHVHQVQIRRGDPLIAAHQQRVVNGVLQLADVAWPAVLQQLAFGFDAQ